MIACLLVGKQAEPGLAGQCGLQARQGESPFQYKLTALTHLLIILRLMAL